eukprot:TRINITY_DN12874_c0_g1_i3.p1 TRINITY_DN12874_c0_g1~~TRINITY_DN12874_c0_g1_i3.p1  ORF type:complete len:213 (+),score=30.49 TRINITY_DN12874_c0_g1_i3:90-728(+)
MVDYSRVSSHELPQPHSFRQFLALNSQLLLPHLIESYYSVPVLTQPQAQDTLVLPDLQPLPSLVTDISKLKMEHAEEKKEVPDQAVVEHDLVSRFEALQLRSWSHEVMVQVIFSYLSTMPRKEALDKILSGLERFQGEGYNLTVSYFWIQMLHFAIESLPATQRSFQDVMQAHPEFRDPLLYLQYYSTEKINEGARDMQLPDKKPLPNLIHR